MRKPITEPDTRLEEAEISAIKLFKHIKKNIRKINTPPLTEELLEINIDAYRELGNGNAEGVIFSHIGVPFPKRYTDLPFDMAFAEDGVALAIGNGDFIFSHYAHIGGSEEDIADKLTSILVGLANGQLAMLTSITQDNEKVQAWEILYRKPGRKLYDALATYAAFDSARKLKNRQMTTEKFANTADIEDVAIDVDTYKVFTFETSWLNQFNRKRIAGLHTPLTREDWEKSVDSYYDQKTDEITNKVDAWANKDSGSLWGQILNTVKWRHLELMWWSTALLLYKPISGWSVEYLHPGFFVFIIFVIVATICRNNDTFRKYFPSIRLAAYIGFILASFIYLSYHDGSLWWVILGLVSVLTFVENIFFDIYTFYARKRNKRA